MTSADLANAGSRLVVLSVHASRHYPRCAMCAMALSALCPCFEILPCGTCLAGCTGFATLPANALGILPLPTCHTCLVTRSFCRSPLNDADNHNNKRQWQRQQQPEDHNNGDGDEDKMEDDEDNDDEPCLLDDDNHLEASTCHHPCSIFFSIGMAKYCHDYQNNPKQLYHTPASPRHPKRSLVQS